VVAESSQAQIDALLARLNPPQQEAVTHGDGPLLIFAGAGSGKTRVLTARIAYLIASRRVWPDRLLAVTFTNKAAREMRGRVEALVGEGAEKMWVGTFHSTAVKILRREAQRIGIRSSFVIFDEDDTRAALKRVLDELRLDPSGRRTSPTAATRTRSCAACTSHTKRRCAARAGSTSTI